MSEQEYSAQGSDHEVTEALGGVPPSATEALAGLVPQVRIVHGTPDDEEVAALVASLVAAQVAVAAHAAATRQADPPSLGTWTDRGRALRLPPRPGPGAWSRSLHL